MSRAVGEQFSAKRPLPSRFNVQRCHTLNLAAWLLLDHAIDEVPQKQRKRFLIPTNRFLHIIHELRRRCRTVFCPVRKFLHDLAKVRVFASHRPALRPNADLTGTVPAQHETVLHQGHAQGLPRSRDGRAQACVTTSNDDQIKLAGFLGQAVWIEPLLAGLCERRAVWRRESWVVTEKNCVAATVKTGEVMQRDWRISRLQVDCATRLPMPFRAFRAELCCERRPVN